MASIFLSYAREDAAKAARVAATLEAVGHSLWWDRNIGAGARFTAEIEAALRAAELVVVLWSKASVRSAWVQDEAAAGRDSGRLVPVLLDQIEPPLGFRQYQAVDLAGGRRDALSLKPLVDAIAARASRFDRPAPPPRSPFPGGIGWRIPALMTSMAVLLLGLWLFLLRPAGPQSHIVAVAAAEGGDAARSQELARTVALDLGRFRAGPLGALTILRGNHPDASRADYRVEVGLSEAGSVVRADVSLLSPKEAQILWTTTVEGRPRRSSTCASKRSPSWGTCLPARSRSRPTATRSAGKSLVST